MPETKQFKPLLTDRQRALLARLLKEQPKQNAIDFYAQFVGSGDLCFDVGANVGNRTTVFTRLGASVVAIEPQSECVHLLKMLYRSNPNVHVLQKAVGDAEGTAELSTSSFSTVSSLSPEWRQKFKEWESPTATWDGTESVAVTTLGLVIEDYGVPRFIKIDVEGYEAQVLKGLPRPVDALSFEFHSFLVDAARECLGLLAGLGPVTLNYTVEDIPSFMLEEWVSPEEMSERLTQIENRPPWYGEIFARFAKVSDAR